MSSFSAQFCKIFGHSEPVFEAFSVPISPRNGTFIAGNNAPVCVPTPARRGHRASWDGRPCGARRRSLRPSWRWCSCGFGRSANRSGGRCGRQRSGCAARPGPLRRRKGSGGKGRAPGPRLPGVGLSTGVRRRIFRAATGNR